MPEDPYIPRYLYRSAQSNDDKTKPALNPELAPLMGMGVKEWVEFTHRFSKEINFYQNEEVTADWQSFFSRIHQGKSSVEDLQDGSLDPHQALYVAFLKLLEIPRKSLNGITERHLDFYYSEVLRIQKKSPEMDRAYVAHTLSKHIEIQLLEKGTAYHGDKCDNELVRTYLSDEDYVVNQAGISFYKSIYEDAHGAIFKNELEELKEIESIYPFGEPTNEEALHGFSVGCADLRLEAGIREIHLELVFRANIKGDLVSTFFKGLQITYSGADGWVSTTATVANGDEREKSIKIKMILQSEDSPLVAPSHEIHARDEAEPVIRFLFTKESLVWRAMIDHNRLWELKLTTHKDYTENLEGHMGSGVASIEGDIYPFGAIPQKGSVFSVHHKEWQGKRIDSASMVLHWKGLPDNFKQHYQAYGLEKGDDVALSNKFEVECGNQTEALFKVRENKITVSDISTIEGFNLGEVYRIHQGENYPIRLTLVNDFMHSMYSQVFASAVISKSEPEGKGKDDLPNPPYSPLVKSVVVTINTSSSHESDQFTFYRETPFGYKKSNGLTDQLLEPADVRKGEMLLGITRAIPQQQFQFLVALEEGTENPEETNASQSDKISYSYLNGDSWEVLPEGNLLKDGTDQFLKNGLIKISIPEHNSDYTLLPKNVFWLKIEMTGNFDSVSRMVGLHSQACLSTFESEGNDLGHLREGIPESTISKLLHRKASVKKITQPYASFGGKPEEGKLAYYRRASERLRHKDRVISVVDYETHVLQEFTYIHKVKAVNHSIDSHFLSPGEVIVVVVPSLKKQKVFNKLKPMISQAKLNAIAGYLNRRNSMHVEAKVISPNYMEVSVSSKVKFHDGLDAHFYKTKLAEDITAHLAPWAYDDIVDINFGRAVYASQVIHYIENLTYVDYLKDFRLIYDGLPSKFIETEGPLHVITSAPTHEIELITEPLCAQ